ncbi:hypothetical protein ATCC90586_004247 [Pythium insidiosum]|nr:hypothetical protein ATCC90586_004247 [Pythium insidiosum]
MSAVAIWRAPGSHAARRATTMFPRSSMMSRWQQRGARTSTLPPTGVAKSTPVAPKPVGSWRQSPAISRAETAAMAVVRARPSHASKWRHRGHGPRSKQQSKDTKVDKPSEESIAASDRTHAGNSRLSLSKNALVSSLARGMLRFSNENSYLNWARNGVLSSGVGVAMYAQEHHRGAQLSGAGLLLLGFGYIGVGTAKYIYYILRFRQVMELSWGSVMGTTGHASAALIIWLTATASFLETVPLELDAMLLTEPIVDYLPFRIRQGLIETYSLYLDDLEHHTDEQERVLRAIRGQNYDGGKTAEAN